MLLICMQRTASLFTFRHEISAPRRNVFLSSRYRDLFANLSPDNKWCDYVARRQQLTFDHGNHRVRIRADLIRELSLEFGLCIASGAGVSCVPRSIPRLSFQGEDRYRHSSPSSPLLSQVPLRKWKGAMSHFVVFHNTCKFTCL